jgi:hypothetical protein
LIELNTTDNTKPVIVEELIISKDAMETLHTIMNGKLSKHSKNYCIKQLIGASGCCICGQIPDKKVTYDAGDGAKRLEYYCDKCFTRDKVLLTATNGKDQTIAVVEKSE